MYCGEKIKQLRKARKLEVSDLAKALQVHPDTIYKWERDQAQPRRTLIKAMADFFGINPKDFYTKEEPVSYQKDLFSTQEQRKENPPSPYTEPIHAQQPQVDIAARTIASLDNMVNILNQDNNRLRTENESMRQELQDLKKQIEELKQQVFDHIAVKKQVNGKAAGE